jgi:nucleotide-binding universal stress UspA family protein
MSGFTRILVPIDFSDTADAALACAKEVAAQFGASIRLVHVFDDPFLKGAFASDVYAPVPDTLREAALQDLQHQLADRFTDSDRTRFGGNADVVIGVTAHAIVDNAREHDADLIVMGTNGRRGLSHTLLGSVAERVVRTADCPVLTVRHPGARQQASAPEALDLAVAS